MGYNITRRRMNKPSQHGFSLIELSIMITIFGLLMAAVLQTQVTEREETIISDTESKLDEVERAIVYFFVQYGHLPCPSRLDQKVGDAGYRESSDCSDPAQAGVVHIDPDDDYHVRVGGVPTRTLGIPDRYAADEWGNTISYTIIRDLGIDQATYDTYAPTQTSGYFQVVDGTGAVLHGNDSSELVGYVLTSHGPDKKGAYTKQGITSVDCGNTAVDSENCDYLVAGDEDRMFVTRAINDQASGANYFYDLVRWQSTATLARIASGGSGINYDLLAQRNIIAGEDFTCIINNTNNLQCAGADTDDILGNGASGNSTSFVTEANGFSDWTMINGDDSTACGIRSSGRAYCWGENDNGELGNNSTTASDTPTEVFGNHTDWTYIDAGADHACGIRNSGEAYCWGLDDEGQLGNGTDGASQIPDLVDGGHSDWIMITVGSQHSCGVRSTGDLYCWGDDGTTGKLGNGAGEGDKDAPFLVTGAITDWNFVHTTSTSTCAIRDTGEMRCWGEDRNSNLGTGGGNEQDPTIVTGAVSDWNYVWTGTYTTCGVNDSSELYCWGRNNNGQIDGVGGGDIGSPQQVGTDTDWISAATKGEFHTCGVKSSGELWCWGENPDGQFGDGSTNLTPAAPAQTTGITVQTN